MYGIVVVVVMFSVLFQGSSVPFVVRALKLPSRTRELEPWALAVRLRQEPGGVHRLRVASGSVADGMRISDLADHIGDMWVSIVVRQSQLVTVRNDSTLRAGDDVVVLADPELHDSLVSAFTSHPGRSQGAYLRSRCARTLLKGSVIHRSQRDSAPGFWRRRARAA